MISSATSATSHSVLLDFCGAPCLIQCDPEPFLPDALAKRILAECSSAMTSGENKQQQQQQQTVAAAAASAVVLDSSTNCSTWPSPELIAQSSPLTAPTIVGALNPATGVTDPALLLEGLPGASGPLVLLHIWSGSAEAVRRASFLELAHVRMLVFRYHVVSSVFFGGH